MEANVATQTIITTINSMFEQLFGSLDNSLYSTLDEITFVNSNILKNNYFEKILGTSTTNGILLIANSLLLGIILYFAIKYLLSHFTYSEMESPKEFIFKLIIFGICMNFSYFLLEQVINIFYYISIGIKNIGENIYLNEVSFNQIINIVNSIFSISNNALNMFTLNGLLRGAISFSMLHLLLTYAFRYVMIKIFALLTPFAILSLSLKNTSWFFTVWAKNLFSLLFIQIIVALVLVILFSTDFTSGGLLSKFIYIGGIYALIKANSFVRDFIGGISTNI
ncbi:MAG: hypothetical protein IJJ82_08015 [Clostridia bacterium]|nr:hypothetical protein [Clostridia bacterium]